MNSNTFSIEKELWEFKGDPFLITPFKCREPQYSLKKMIMMMWFIYRTKNHDMIETYPKNIDKAFEYLAEQNVDANIEMTSIVYKSFEKIVHKYMIKQPKNYVSIRFIDDFEYVNIVKRNDLFHILSGTFIDSRRISEIFKIGSYKDITESHDCIFVFGQGIAYDTINDTDLITVPLYDH